MRAETILPGELRESRIPPTVFDRLSLIANRSLVPFGLVTLAIAVLMLVGLHLLPGWGGVNPMTGMLSDYGVQPVGWVFDAALDVMSIGSAAVVVTMVLHGVVRDGPSLLCMVSWCVCLVGIATFTKDPNAGAQTVVGWLHLTATAAACISLPLGSFVLGLRHRRDPRWRRFAWLSQGLALVCVPCGMPFVVSFFVIRFSHASGPSALPTGLVERLMATVDVVILIVLALWAHHAATTRRRALR
jgi:hypothetical protein